MPEEILVEPRNTAAPDTAPVEPRAGAESLSPSAKKSGLSEDLLRIPAIQGLFSGQPAAISATIEEFQKRPEAKIIIDNKPALMKAGMGFYRALDGGTGVVFNQMFLNGEELKSADEAGQLAQIAPPFDSVNSSIAQSGANNPVLNAGAPPGAFKTAPVKTPPQAASAVPPASAGVQNQAQRARQKNMAPSSPTSGPKPGAGRLLNSILKPVL